MKKSQTTLFIFLGILFWLNGVMFVRFLGPIMLTENNPLLIVVFPIVILITILSLIITKFLSGLTYSELLKPTTIMTFAATMLDGLCLLYFRWVYSESFEIALHGAAFILWGAGLGLFFAYILEIRASK